MKELKFRDNTPSLGSRTAMLYTKTGHHFFGWGNSDPEALEDLKKGLIKEIEKIDKMGLLKSELQEFLSENGENQ